MLTVEQARASIMRHVAPLPAETVPLTAHLLGRFLAEDVTAPDDAPPHDKAMMDGFAVRSADLASGQTTFEIVEEIKAGQVPCRALQERQASRIMTGAPLPQGADAVIMVERSRLLDAGHVFLDDSGAKPGQHILAKGGEMRNGATVLSVGSVIQPQEIAILAAVGRSKVAVVSTPTVAILSTGDEVIDPPDIPAPGQIRNSNGPMLMAQATRAGSVPRYLGVVRDQPDSLRRYIEDGLKANVFLLSGGVSAGVFDLVPGLLRAAGVEEHLHKVAMKPGKPVFFGTFARPGAAATLVFGLPGNPVSSFVCFELFVRPALRRMRGQAETTGQTISAVLTDDFPYRTDRPTFHPAELSVGGQGWQVRPVPWGGSSDLRGLTRANALIEITVGDGPHRAGQRFAVVRLDGEM